MGRTSRFTSMSCCSTHTFTFPCNYRVIFPSSQNIGIRIAGSMTTIGTYVVVFPRPARFQVKKLYPMVVIGVYDEHQVCPISLHFWNIYLLPLKLSGLECDTHHVIFRFPFSNSTQKILVLPIFFSGKCF